MDNLYNFFWTPKTLIQATFKMTHYPKFFLNTGIGGKRLLLLTKNALLKRWQKIWALPPSFGQNPKEQQLFSLPLPYHPYPYTSIFLCVSLFLSLKPDSSILTVWHILMHPARTEQKTSCFSYLLILVLCLTVSKKIEVSIGNNQHLF